MARRGVKWAIAVALGAGFLFPASGQATVTIGQVGEPDTECDIGDWLSPTVTSSPTSPAYEVPASGGIVNWTLTSWSHFAAVLDGQMVKVKVYRPVSGLTYTVVGQDSPRQLASAVLNTFSANIAVKAGDFLGMTSLTEGTGCGFGPLGETFYFSATDQPNGAPVTFESGSGERINISATIEPTGAFSFGQTTRSKKKGTATITVDVPNPGDLAASGKGVKAAGVATTSKAVSGPGTTTLLIKAKGKKKKKLNGSGKVKLGVDVTFTPTGGTASTASTTVKLKKKL
jgi:hypothetical protein